MKTGVLEIHYIDEEKDDYIITPVVRTGNVGTDWKIEADEFKQFNGYVLSMVDHNHFGIFTEDKQIVKFWYKKIVEKPKEDKPITTNTAGNHVVPKTGIQGEAFFHISTLITSLSGIIILKKKNKVL